MRKATAKSSKVALIQVFSAGLGCLILLLNGRWFALLYERALVSALLVFHKGGRYDVHNINRIVSVFQFDYIIDFSYCFDLRT